MVDITFKLYIHDIFTFLLHVRPILYRGSLSLRIHKALLTVRMSRLIDGRWKSNLCV